MSGSELRILHLDDDEDEYLIVRGLLGRTARPYRQKYEERGGSIKMNVLRCGSHTSDDAQPEAPVPIKRPIEQ